MSKKRKYLIVNPGSASRKYALYENKGEVLTAHFEKDVSSDGFVVSFLAKRWKIEKKLSARDYENSMFLFLDFLLEKKLIASMAEINTIGFRVVAPGSYFAKTHPINAKYIKKLGEMQKTAFLHIEPTLLEIKKAIKLFPKTKRIGVSDSAFHSTMLRAARTYGLPFLDVRKLELYRYGYHGISVESVLRKIKKMFKKQPARIIVCHLGSGVSVTAIKDGKSIDTSMGFTPLEGLLMSTRGGDIDSGALIYLAKKLKLSYDKLDEYLNKKCGLLGISKKTSDVRELLAIEKNNANAALALEVFVYRIKKYIGAYIAIINGSDKGQSKLDLLVFTATIGERSSIIRKRICQGLEPMGIVLDKRKNKQIAQGEGFIQTQKSETKIVVIKTNEMKEIALKIQK